MIHVDESDPVGEIEASFPTRDVTIKKGVNAKEFYDMIKEIGRGKFGTVYKCKEKSTDLQLAAKFVPIPKRDDRRNVEREVEIMNSLQHPRIIQLYDAFEYDKMMCVVLELIEGGELFERVIDDDFILTERACTCFVRQLCEAMEFVHRKNILHLDMKPENILCLTREGNRIKIIDFGLARKFDPDKKLQVLFGTPEFVAPEVVNFDTISFGTDMWSLGVICYVLLSGLSPFMGETDIETMANVTIAKYDFDDDAFNNVSKDAIDFISKLLIKDSNARLTATQCLEHPWLLKKCPPKPSLAPKPMTVPPMKLIKEIPTSPKVDDNLESTKDNLKHFVERWGEHPNSPYVFDKELHLISPIKEGIIFDTMSLTVPKSNNINNNSNLSSRGCSPSPCESLTSTPDIIETQNGVDLEDDDKKSIIDKISQSPPQPSPPSSYPMNPVINDEEQNEAMNNMKNLPASHKFTNKMFREYLQSFERRNSDSNYLLKQTSTTEKINLADEIKKLSDRLMMLSAMNAELNGNTDNGYGGGDSKIDNQEIHINGKYDETLNGDTYKEEKINSNENSEFKVKSKIAECFNKSIIVSPPELNNMNSHKDKRTSTFARSSSVMNNSNIVSSISESISRLKNISTAIASSSITSSSSTVSGNSLARSQTLINSNGLSERLHKTIDETPKLNARLTNGTSSVLNGKRSESIPIQINSNKNTNHHYQQQTITTTASSSSVRGKPQQFSKSTTSTTSTTAITGAPWPVTNKRTKFRITQMSRDVPIGSPNTHQTIFIEESANTTKDCLLHLLEKYNDTKNDYRTFKSNMMGARHQSFSLECGHMADNLEYRSMNSINAFFQRHSANVGNSVKQIQAQIEAKNKQ